jgi:Ca-activated chloride channel homolog
LSRHGAAKALALGAAILGALLALSGVRSAAASPAGDSSPSPFRVKITEPVDGDFVFGKSKIVAEVKSKDTVKGIRVEFSVGGKLIFIDREPPFECFHEFGEQPRSWVIEAKAIAPDGLTVTDTIVTRKLDIHYREEVDRVVLAVSATTDENAFAEGLTKADFSVTESEVPQQILEFGVETRPITIGVIIDTSGSMKEEIGHVQVAAKDFVKTIRPEDRAFVVDLDENVFLLQDLTNDHALLQKAIEGTDAEGGTALYDALWASYWKMKSIQGRRALIPLTDGEDTNSRFSFQKVVELTRTNDVILYPIGLSAGLTDFQVRGSLKQLADDTGGRVFFPKSDADVARAYGQIAADLRSQYFLTYSPSNTNFDGKWRPIKVECHKPGVNIKTRRGYYAVKH